jgi:hypothetical protein
MARPLFARDCLADGPSLGRIQQTFLRSLPDDWLFGGLRSARGRGGNDSPEHVLREAVMGLWMACDKVSLFLCRSLRPLGSQDDRCVNPLEGCPPLMDR